MSFSLTAVVAFAHGCAEGRHGPGPDAGDARGDEPPVQVDAGAIFADASPEPDATGSDRPHEPDASAPADERLTLTYNSSLEIAPDSDLVCFDEQTLEHRDNHYFRVFDLAGDFDLPDGFVVESISIGILLAQGSGGSQQAAVRVGHQAAAATPDLAEAILLRERVVSIPDGERMLFEIDDLDARIPAGSALLVEFFTPSGVPGANRLYIGGNFADETAPSFLLARDCGIDEPLTFGALGFGAHRWVVTVEGRPAT